MRGARRRRTSTVRCSTPFGITEGGIGAGNKPSPGSRAGAQRLSASQRGGMQIVGPVATVTMRCSTPFGITEGGIRHPIPICPHSDIVLNAFRHHRGGHMAETLVDPVKARQCSTPFGSTEGGIARRSETRIIQDMCSTPFGITEGGIPFFQAQPPLRRLCSTPFGITEGGICGDPGEAREVGGGAQRLSASQREERLRRPVDRADEVLNAFRHQEGGTQSAASKSRQRRVLNAFRHHRGGQRLRDLFLGGSHGAQRLSASRGGMRVASTYRGRQRAQRLSASQRWACERSTGPALGCSTPFGITEVGKVAAPSETGQGQVLNAFRHHRGGHTWSIPPAARRTSAQRLSASQRWARRLIAPTRFSHQCSTPFGITEGRNARNAPPIRPFRPCAQRLSASQREASSIGAPLESPTERVLNAFRHHRGRHLGMRRRMCARQHGVLNAFRHHRGRNVSAWAAPERPRPVLNAFRHHRGSTSPSRSSADCPMCSTPFGITEGAL